METSKEEKKILKLLKKLAVKMPKFPDGRIDYHGSKTAVVVTAFLLYKDKILLLKRSDKVYTDKEKWDALTGYVDVIRPFREEALEEMREETGIKDNVINSVTSGKPFRFFEKQYNRTWVVCPVLIKLSKKPKVTLNKENDAYKWVRKSEIHKYDIVAKLTKSLKNAFIT